MQKGFGLIFILIGVLFILLAAGAGFWWGRRSLPQTNPVITSASLNQNQSTASAQSTTFMKRSFDPTQGLYPEKPLPQEITGVAEENLTGFNCDGPYIQNSDGQYLWSLQLDGEAYLKPLSTDITTEVSNLNNYLKGVGSNQPAVYVTYCVTDAGGKYLLAGQPMTGGGAGSDTYITDLNHGIGGPLSGLIKSEPWPYFGCSNIMQLTKSEMYIACSAGDGGFSGQAIYKKSLSSNQVTTVIKCTNQLSEDMKTSNVTCE